MQSNINEYNELEFREKFSTTELYSQLTQEYDRLCFAYHFDCWAFKTPREQYAIRQFSVVPFYYLEYLTKYNPKNIYDLGCGWNIFKRYFPNIIGVGAETGDDFHGDLHDFVDDDYIANHQNYFESVFSINALHFVALRNLRKRVLDFASMIKPGGRGFITFNLQRMLEAELLTENESDNRVTFSIPNLLELGQPFNITLSNDCENYIRTELSNVEFTYEVFDVNLLVVDEVMNGNIRLVIYKP